MTFPFIPQHRRGGKFGASAGVTKPGRKVEVRTDLSHVYSTESGTRASLQGMRCKILIEKKAGHVLVEFEKGQIETVHVRSLKRLPRC